MSDGTRNRPPLSPLEVWLSDGRQVLYFQPVLWDRWNQPVDLTVGELLPDQPVPLLKRRTELSREEALKLWAEKRQQGLATHHGAAAAAGESRLDVSQSHGAGPYGSGIPSDRHGLYRLGMETQTTSEMPTPVSHPWLPEVECIIFLIASQQPSRANDTPHQSRGASPLPGR